MAKKTFNKVSGCSLVKDVINVDQGQLEMLINIDWSNAGLWCQIAVFNNDSANRFHHESFNICSLAAPSKLIPS